MSISINLFNNKGLQTEDSFLDIPQSDVLIPQSPVIKGDVTDENKKKFDEIKKDLDSKILADEKNKRKNKDKKRLNAGVFFSFFLILLIGAGILYLFNYTNIPNKVFDKLSQWKTNGKFNETPKTDRDSGFGLPENYVTSEIVNQIIEKSKDLSLISGILELLPENVQIMDFYIKNDNLSLICLVKDIISGENIKFYIYNHKDSFKPELFYIEKTEDEKNYQITSLSNILVNPVTDHKYIYLEDRQLTGYLTATANQSGVEMEPLTISKRDPALIRSGFIYLTGSKSSIVHFFRSLSSKRINISYDEMEIKSPDTSSAKTVYDIKIGITIFPQK
ncbi:MAG: hypothetical protein JXQ65_11570 [Candidatus Marinimicrobia bacterium]|nr:hypothetical protein [Candidatus Neomarinimicrobiota bacterium]